MPILSGQVGRYGIKATPDILGPHKGIPWRSPALSNAQPTINGRTHDSTGALLGNCTVWAMNTQSDTVMGTTTSDSNGLFSLTLYTSGSYYLVAYRAGVASVAVLPAQISLSRASSGTYYNSSGVITTVSNDVARFDYTYNGSVWSAAGLLVEEQRTNITTGSGDLWNGALGWIRLESGASNVAIAPDGTMSAAQVTSNGGGSAYAYQLNTLTSGVDYTFSIYVKKDVGTDWLVIFLYDTTHGDVNCWFNVTTGAFGTIQAGAIANTIQNVGNGWWRISVTVHTGGTSTDYGVTTVDADNSRACVAGHSQLYWGAQTEQGSAPSSYIATTAAAVTRSADVVSSTDATLLAAKGWIVEVGELQASTAATLLGINTVIGLGATSGNALTTADGGAQTTGNTGTWTSQNRGGLAFDSTPRVSIDLNGGTVVTAGNTPTTPTNLYFGNTNNGASGFLNGHIRLLAAYSAITDGQLPGLSTVGASLTSVLSPTFSVQWAGTASDLSGTTVNTLIPT